MTDQLFSVDGQVTVVSGGSRGIGRALAAGFVERNARVIITGRDEAVLKATADEISTADNKATPIVCDVSQPDDIDRLVESVVADFGQIDSLLNVAGVNKRQPVENFTLEEYDFILDINLRGAFYLAQQVGKQMIARKSGSIINIDSLNTNSPLKGVTPYAMSKGGLNIMTRGMAAEWGSHGIRVNSIAPGFILTDLTRKLWSDPTMNAWGCGNTPLGRMGEVEDLVGTAIFLSSPAAAFLTGQIIYVDGGFTAGTLWPIEM